MLTMALMRPFSRLVPAFVAACLLIADLSLEAQTTITPPSTTSTSNESTTTPSTTSTSTASTTTSEASSTTTTTPAVTTTVVTGSVAVFRLTFEQTGDSINYRPYQGGYYIAPLEGGSGSLILTLSTGTQKQYFSYEAFGELFVAVKGREKRMVLSATATNDVSTTVFYAIGDTDREIEVEGRNAVSKVKVAEKMTGYAVSADSEQDLPFNGVTTSNSSIGVAGVSILTARLDETLTNVAIRDDLDVAAEVDTIIAILEGAGYVNGNQQTTTGTATTGTTAPTGQ